MMRHVIRDTSAIPHYTATHPTYFYLSESVGTSYSASWINYQVLS